MPNFNFLIISFAEILLFCAGEVIKWKSDYSEFRPNDGVCTLAGGKTLTPKNVPNKEEGVCGDKLYSLLKHCAKQSFYIGLNRPRSEFAESALYLINGCLECPYGKAEATVSLHNHLPSGSLFSGCGQEDKIVSSVSVKLTSEKNVHGHGSFSLGGILEGRKCNGLFDSSRETMFEKIVLEVKHNCGQKKPMTLFVLLPPVDLPKLFSERNNFREWDGIRVDLGIFGVGWNERWLDFGDVFHSTTEAKQLPEVQIHSNNSSIIQHDEKPPISVLPTPVEFIEESEKSNEQKDKNNHFEFNLPFIFACVLVPLLLGFSLIDHEDEHNENNEPDEVGVNDVKCQNWKGKNTTDDDDLMDEQFTELENCIWNSLLAKEHAHSPRQIHPLLSPPPEYPLKFSVENLVVEQVDTSWNDSRLQWEKSEWALEGISLEEDRRRELWTPDFMDDSYPEERNDCCLFLGLADIGRTVEFTVGAKSKFATLAKQVHVRRDRPMSAVVISNLMETSPWAVQSQAIEPARVDGSRSDSLRLCVQSKKEMSTLRIALRIPVTIATLLTLVSPLFGDLRSQALVKCLTLLLQTICFLFLCSIAPASGFGGSKPKLYTFYEFMFTLTFLSILVTTACLALSRMKRTVPATHSVYLGAKVSTNKGPFNIYKLNKN
uniref:Uncharacterized protein n=1 Tax=Meloidogyne javanica TaxID=6303 RepID=A0A915N1J2_MELJA